MPELKDFIGTWKTTDFPGYVGNGQNTITLYVSKMGIATLWKLEGNQSTIFSEGDLEINDNKDGSFDLTINGHAIDKAYRSISGNLFFPNPPPSFVSEIPEHGKRYFEKLQ